jgi:hypothetical protein
LPRRLRASNPASQEPSSKSGAGLGISFVNVARESGLNVKTIFGGEHKNKYLLETTGCGVAFYDFDNDGWLDIFLVNGSRLEGFAQGQEPTSHLFKNNRDGTFIDVTAKARVGLYGWGQGFASATTTTTDSKIFSSVTSAGIVSTTTMAMARSPKSPRKPASRATASDGTRAAPSWTTIATTQVRAKQNLLIKPARVSSKLPWRSPDDLPGRWRPGADEAARRDAWRSLWQNRLQPYVVATGCRGESRSLRNASMARCDRQQLTYGLSVIRQRRYWSRVEGGV